MSSCFSLSLTEKQHQELVRHLFPGDGNEAVAIILCGRRDGDRRHRLLVREVHPIPYHVCTARTPTRVTWPTDFIEPLLEKATKQRLSVFKVHSHPGGYRRFSDTDDISDRELLPSVRGWVEHNIPHGSVVMLPTGEMFGRVYVSGPDFIPLDLINVVGSDLHFWFANRESGERPEFVASHAQAFGDGTTAIFQQLTFAVIGASGTGSPIIEMLVRLGAREIIIVDDDKLEVRNINRILNSTMQDARDKKLKVDVLGDAVEKMEIGTRVIRIAKNLWDDPNAIRQIAQADVIFGCMDSIDGRYLLNLLATYYCQPYFDIGVRLDAVPTGAERGKIREICGTVNYLQPGLSSLMTRGLFSMNDVKDAGLRRRDPNAHAQQVKDGYIKGVHVSRPAVISVNMYAAALAVNDLLARLHPYREETNRDVASIEFSLKSLEQFTDPEGEPCGILKNCVGKGDVTPLLDTIELSEKKTI